MKFIIVLAAVAACAFSDSISSRRYSKLEDSAVLEEVEVDNFEESYHPSEEEIVLQETYDSAEDSDDSELPSGISSHIAEQVDEVVGQMELPELQGVSQEAEEQGEGEDEETGFPNLPGISVQTEVQIEEVPGDTELPGLSVETEVIGESESVPRQKEDDVDAIVASISINQLFQASSTYDDRMMVINDLTNLNNAIAGEKKAFDNMLLKTSEMKMANKTACLQAAIDQIVNVSVDGTKLNVIQSNLTAMYTRLQQGNYNAQLIAQYKELILTGNNTFITQILDEGQKIADNMEEAVNNMTIDQKC